MKKVHVFSRRHILEYLLGTYYALRTVLGDRERAVKRMDRTPCPDACIVKGEEEQLPVNISHSGYIVTCAKEKNESGKALAVWYLCERGGRRGQGGI